jgi:hypothetical protein
MSTGIQKDDHAVGLYLDWFKKTLTNTIYKTEPGEVSEASFVRGLIDHYIQGAAISMLPWRLALAHHLFMRVVKARGVIDRSVWVPDSFEGLPEPDGEKFPIEAVSHSGSLMTKVYDHFAVDLEAVKSNFRAYGLLDEQDRFLQGWFKHMLPTAPISSLAITRLDGEYYESTTDPLTNLYDKLSVGGYVIVTMPRTLGPIADKPLMIFFGSVTSTSR